MGKKKKEIKKAATPLSLSANKYFYFILLIVPVILYFHCIDYSYTSMDDEQILRNNSAFLKDINNLPEAFKVDAFIQRNSGPLYRPLQTITYMLDYQLVQKEDSLKSFHITNIVLNVLVILLIFNLLLRLKIERVTAFLLVLLYSVHPLLTAAVVWIPSRGDLLLAFFTLLSLITFLEFNENKKLYYLCIHAVLFFLALLSKETAVLIPLMIIGIDLIVNKRKLWRKENLIFGAVWGIEIILFMIIRKFGLNAPPLANDVFGIKSIMENLPVIAVSSGKFFFPHDLTTYAMFKIYSVVIGCIAMAVGLFLIIQVKANRLPMIAGWLWFFLFTIPPMIFRHQFAKYGTDYLEHRAYLPVIGLLIFIALLIEGYFSGKSYPERLRITKKPGLVTLYAAVFIFFIYSAYNHSLDYKDQITFSNSSIESCDKNAIGYNERANARIISQDYSAALLDLDRSIELCPINPQAYNNRGVIYLNINQLAKALEYSSTSISMDKSFTLAYLTRASAEIRLKMYNEAVADLNILVKLDPSIAAAYYDRAVAYEFLNDDEKALNDYSMVIKLEPANIDVQNKIVLLSRKLNERKSN